MDLLRTPDERFAEIPDFDYSPHYLEVGGIRIAHVDQGAGPVVLLMHGEPSWSFLYRKMIPILVGAGYRVLAPDLVGLGRSDKPTDPEAYSYQAHVDWMQGWLASVGVGGITLFGQDWGGLIGLRLVVADPDRFTRVAVANTGLPTGDHDLGEAFHTWRRWSREVPEFPVGWLVQRSTVTELTPEVVAAYDAPFLDESYKVGVRRFPMLVPDSPDDPASEPNRRAWQVLAEWRKPFLTLFSDSDPVTAGAERPFHRLIPGAAGQPHRPITGAGHFLQEDKGEELASILVEWMG